MATGDAGRPGAAEPIFRTVRRGFDPEQVLSYLRQLGERVQGLEVQLRQAQRDLEETRSRSASDPRDRYAGVSEHVVDLLRGFEEEVDRARAKAEADAGRIEAEARAKADLDVTQAREAAERIRADLESVRTTTSSELRAMREHMTNSLHEIDAALEGASSSEGVMVLHEAEPAPTPVPGPPTDHD